MKQLLCLLLCFVTAISLCACGNSQAQKGLGSEIRIDSDSEETTDHYESPANFEMLASECLSSITDISDEWQPGTYLVYGMDHYGQPCYGIWNSNGTFESLSGYAAYFPLADGNLLVTNDADVDRSLRAASHKSTNISHGKIIDRSGNILFEAADNQRMHIINSTAVMLIEATSGFDGETICWGVIDNQGNWLHNMDDSGPLPDFLTNYLKFDSGDTWSYSSKISIERSEGYDGVESGSLVIYKDSKNVGTALVYNLGEDNFFSMESYQSNINQVSANEWLTFSMSINSPWGTSTSYNVIDQTGQKTGTIGHYCTTINGVKYWRDYTWFDEELVIASDKNPEGYTFPSEYSLRVESVVGFLEGQVYLVVKGADGRMYFVAHDMEGNTVIDPILLDGFMSGRTALVGNQFVCYDSEDMLTLYTLNPATGAMTSSYLGIDEYHEIWSMGNGLFAILFDMGDYNIIHIFTLDGKQLF